METSEMQTLPPMIIVSADCAPTCSTNHQGHRRRNSGSKTFPLRKSPALINLANGYDKFKASFLSLPADFGEASSDDLSSEWASSETDKENEKQSDLHFAPKP